MARPGVSTSQRTPRKRHSAAAPSDGSPSLPRLMRKPAASPGHALAILQTVSSSGVTDSPFRCVSSSSESPAPARASPRHAPAASGEAPAARAAADRPRSSSQVPPPPKPRNVQDSRPDADTVVVFPVWPLSLVGSQEAELLFGTGMEEGTLLAPPGLPFFRYDNFSPVNLHRASALNASCDVGSNALQRPVFAAAARRDNAPSDRPSAPGRPSRAGLLPSSSRMYLVTVSSPSAAVPADGSSDGVADLLAAQVSHFSVLQDGLCTRAPSGSHHASTDPTTTRTAGYVGVQHTPPLSPPAAATHAARSRAGEEGEGRSVQPRLSPV
ncbi:MAG: hypothetical protein WDW36_005542 [Sanguina aurantia]